MTLRHRKRPGRLAVDEHDRRALSLVEVGQAKRYHRRCVSASRTESPEAHAAHRRVCAPARSSRRAAYPVPTSARLAPECTHLALQLAPILAAEKSKVPFYIAGGLLVAWALIVSLALGMRKPEFPRQSGGSARRDGRLGGARPPRPCRPAVITSGGSSTAGRPRARPAATSTESAPAPAAASTQSRATPRSRPRAAPQSAPAAPAKGGAASALKLAANPGGLLSFDH